MSYRAAWCRWACTGQGASRVVGWRISREPRRPTLQPSSSCVTVMRAGQGEKTRPLPDAIMDGLHGWYVEQGEMPPAPVRVTLAGTGQWSPTSTNLRRSSTSSM